MAPPGTQKAPALPADALAHHIADPHQQKKLTAAGPAFQRRGA